MDLREIIQNSLTDIIHGVQAAQKIEGCEGLVCPQYFADKKFPAESGVVAGHREVATVVRFDVAEMARKTTALDAKGMSKIIVVDASLDGKLENRSETTSRIQFSVPIQMPQG